MKIFNTVVSIVLLIAVGYLFIHEFGDSKPKNDIRTESEVEESLSSQDFSGVRIAYINTDSLVENYDLHQKLKAQLEEKARNLESDLMNKSEVFQQNVELLQNQAANMSQDELQAAQMDLQQTQQQLMAYRDQKSQELAIQQRSLDSLIKVDMEGILENVKTEFGLDYILSYDPNSILLAANENYDITDIVVKRLNEKNTENKATKEEE